MTGSGGRTVAYWCGRAWVDGVVAERVRLVVEGPRFTEVSVGVDPKSSDDRLPGLVLPGFADAHSHAFHRALRGRTHDRGGTFWTWRERMYAVAGRLDPDSYLALARATYAEMALSGVSAVGEFHYLHHGPGGIHYDDPNAMSRALVQAASEAGVRLTLLDTCYLAGGLDADGYRPLDVVQQRFSDGTADAWAARVDAMPVNGVTVGAAVHSVRAVPADQLDVVVAAATGRPLHVHLSEQPAENDACLAHYGCSPTALLERHGVLGRHTTAIHAVHLTDHDIRLLGTTRTAVCACPSTEADLADGIGPFRRLRDAGSPLCLGSDQHPQTDLLAEAQRLEAGERLVTQERGRFTPVQLLDALAPDGHAALGHADAGRLAVGQRADLVAVRLDSVRTAGADPAQVVLVAGAPDVDTVLTDGRIVVRGGEHVLGDVGRLLTDAITPLWADLC